MEKNGNKKKNQYYEASLPSDFHRPSHHNSHLFHQFIYEKYCLLRFISIQAPHELPKETYVMTLKDEFREQEGEEGEEEEEYKCERDGGNNEKELTKFIQRIGENRKIIPKEILGPVYLQKELQKKSLEMKQRYVEEEKKKHDQLIRSISAIHKISQRKKEFNRSQSEMIKPFKEKKELQDKEWQFIRHEEKYQKICESEQRRKEKKAELKKRSRFLFYSNLAYTTPRIHSSLDSDEEKGSCYPPLPKKIYLHKFDKTGSRYTVSIDRKEESALEEREQQEEI